MLDDNLSLVIFLLFYIVYKIYSVEMLNLIDSKTKFLQNLFDFKLFAKL